MQRAVGSAYQRARSPAQKAERSARIVAAARELLAEGRDSRDLSLSDLARRAGMAKSNVYRYFESREAVLLMLLAEDWTAWAAEMGAVAAEVEANLHRPVAARLEEVAARLAAATTRRPQLCKLMSVLPSVLEQNVSLDTVRAFKRGSATLRAEVRAALHGALPELGIEQHDELLGLVFVFLVGGWPLAHPVPCVREALRLEGLDAMHGDFEGEMARAYVLLARGLLVLAEERGR